MLHQTHKLMLLTVICLIVYSSHVQGQTPAITSINPAVPTARRDGSTQLIQVNGTGFQAGLTVITIDPGGTQYSLGTPIPITATSVSVSMALPRGGGWTVFVVNPGAIVSNQFHFTVGCDPNSLGGVVPACGVAFGPLAAYLGVGSESNGCDQGTGEACAGRGALGLQFQCVEYVRRVVNAVDSTIDTSGRNAIDFWRNPPAEFVKFDNYGKPPKAGDIIVWSTTGGASTNRFGHVAVIAEALPSGTPSTVRIVEQNWSRLGEDTLPVAVDGLGNYSIQNTSTRGLTRRNRRHALLGWLRVAAPAVRVKPFGSQPLANGPFKVEVVNTQLNPTPAPADISVTALRQVISQCSGILFSSTRTLSIPQGQGFATFDAAGRDPACNTLPIRTRWTVQGATIAPNGTALDLSAVPAQQLVVEIIR